MVTPPNNQNIIPTPPQVPPSKRINPTDKKISKLNCKCLEKCKRCLKNSVRIIKDELKLFCEKIKIVFQTIFFCCASDDEDDYWNDENPSITPTQNQAAAPQQLPEMAKRTLNDLQVEANDIAKRLSGTRKTNTSMMIRNHKNLDSVMCYMNSSMQILEASYCRGVKLQQLIDKDLSLKDQEAIQQLERRLLREWQPLHDDKEGILFKWTFLLVLQAKKFANEELLIQALRLHRETCFTIRRHFEFYEGYYEQKDASIYCELWLDVLKFRMKFKQMLSAAHEGQPIKSHKFEDITLISLELPVDVNEPTLPPLIDNFMHETFDSQENGWKFAINGKMVKMSPYTKSYTFTQFPESLSIQIKRFEMNHGDTVRRKNTKPIELGFNPQTEQLNLSAFGSGQADYDLTGIVVHYGTPESGHFVAYVKDMNSNWWLCDDLRSSIESADVKDVPFKDAYLMTFRQTKRTLEKPSI